jgi:hypothetical protein
MDDLIAFVGRVQLHAATQTGFASLLAGYAQRLGRWPFYRLISKLCFYQTLCQKPEISKADATAHAERIGDVAFWDIASRLQPEIFVRMLYVCVLERGCAPAEQENWIKRLRQGALPCALLLDFLASAEYRQTFPDRTMGDVEDWARREVSLSSGPRTQKRPQMIWPVDTAVRFNEDNPTTEALLGQRWHRRDAQGRWSDGRTGDLRFHLPDGAAQNGATLVLRLRVAGTRITGPRHLAAHVNRREIGTTTLLNDGPQNWALQLPASLHSRDGVSLFLIADQDFSPATGGQSADRRSLGVMLIEGRLKVDAPKTEDETLTVSSEEEAGAGD